MNDIRIQGARQHNLANLDVLIPRNAVTVITGLSGSGKSSLAFDTLYAEGQRRYIESLSTYARQFLEQMEKPDVDSVDGLSPSISIEQKTTSRSPRSTVGTITEIYDYLRLLFSSVGEAHCPNCDTPISQQSVEDIVDRILQLPEASRVSILAPVIRSRKGEFKRLFERFLKEGYIRARVDGETIDLEFPPQLEKQKNHTVDIIVDRLVTSGEMRGRVEDSVRQALKITDGLVTVAVRGGEEILFSERAACVECGIDIPTLEPRSFSFNSTFGACPRCKGLGSKLQVNLDRLVVDPSLPALEVSLALSGKDLEYLFTEALKALLRHFSLPVQSPFSALPEPVLTALVGGLEEKIEFEYGGHVYRSHFEGLNKWFEDKLEST
ncbi:MAG: excinuclease ABC subunit UvrA, partial [Acidobacteriota bacterium]